MIRDLSAESASTLRKDFKIRGLGEPHQKDKLSCVSLRHQIREGRSQGYKESQTIERCTKKDKLSDRVLVRNLSERGGTGKLRSYWEDAIQVIVEPKGDYNVVYAIRPEHDKNGKMRIVHKNILMPCDALLKDCTKQPTRKPPKITLFMKDGEGEVSSESSNDEFEGFTQAQLRSISREETDKKNTKVDTTPTNKKNMDFQVEESAGIREDIDSCDIEDAIRKDRERCNREDKKDRTREVGRMNKDSRYTGEGEKRRCETGGRRYGNRDNGSDNRKVYNMRKRNRKFVKSESCSNYICRGWSSGLLKRGYS